MEHPYQKIPVLAARSCLIACLLTMPAMPPAARAAHPLQTEDTGTQGVGNVELENGLLWSRSAGNRLFSYQPQLSFGVTPAFDVIVQPSWLSNQDSGSPTQRGRGDTNLDVKWRFAGAEPWSLALRAGLTLPTAANGLGLPEGRYASHGLLVATWDAAPLTLHANLGLALNPQGSGARARVGTASAALMWSVTERAAADAGQQPGLQPRSPAHRLGRQRAGRCHLHAAAGAGRGPGLPDRLARGPALAPMAAGADVSVCPLNAAAAALAGDGSHRL